MRRLPVRAQITGAAVVVVAAVFLLAAVGLVTSHRAQLRRSLDAALEQRADDIVRLVEDGVALDVLGASTREAFAQVTVDGRVIAATANLASDVVLALDSPPVSGQRFETRSDLAVDDDTFRVLSRSIEVGGADGALHVGATLDEVEESVAALIASLAVTLPLVVVALAGLVWWLVGRTLQPVEHIRSEVASIGAGELGRRVPVPATDDEVGRLAVTMNEMLDRIETAAARQNQFVADASHELRTPLTRLRSNLEVDAVTLGAMTGDGGAIVKEAFDRAVDRVGDLQRLVEDLLYLARSDAGSRGQRVPVDLDDIVLAEASQVRAGGDIVVDVSQVSGAHLTGDPGHLERLVRNLLDNAARHAESRVGIACSEVGDEVWLVVADDGPGIPVQSRERVFERFTRLDDARAATSGGSGLGLAIARDIAVHHGGSIAVEDATPGARMVVRLARGKPT